MERGWSEGEARVERGCREGVARVDLSYITLTLALRASICSASEGRGVSTYHTA